MLNFEEKQAIIESFPQLTRKEVSMKRLNYHFEESVYDKKIIVQHLHPNGNGFVYVEGIPGYETDDRGLMNIREATEVELRQVITDAIQALSKEEKVEEPVQQVWTDADSVLVLKEEEGYWNIYHESNLEESFGDYEDAVAYLKEEQFSLKEEEAKR